MQLSRLIKSNFQQPLVASALAVITGHLIASALFFMEAPVYERLLWAIVATTPLGLAAFAYGGLSTVARGLIGVSVGFPALLFGLGIHVSRVVQVGFATSDVSGLLMAIAGLLLFVIGATILVRIVHAWWRRLLLVPPAVAVAFFIMFPVGLAVFATNVAHVACCDETPGDRGLVYEDVTFETDQGREISAWFMPSANGAVIVTVHGSGNNRATVLDEAEILARHGYGVLMLDVEGYGDSEGRSNAFGWAGSRDVHAATKYLQDRGDIDPDRIGGLGLSMGGEVLLHAAADSTALKAIVAEGAVGRTRDDLDEYGGIQGVLIVPFWEVVETSILALTGEAPPPPFTDLVPRIAHRDVLLIAASLPEEEKLMGMYRDMGGPSFQLWTIPEAKHVGAFDLHREEYEQRVIAFFDNALLGDSAPGAAGVR